MNPYTICEYCDDQNHFADSLDHVQISSNIKKFKDEKFTVWRCRSCQTLHAKEDVDLSYYYKDYPLSRVVDKEHFSRLEEIPLNIRLKRLLKAGFLKTHTLLDYGCGGGAFLSFLKRKGYTHLDGYDKYSSQFGDVSVLDKKYDCVVSQDVIEHVENPFVTFAQLSSFLRPNGILCVGTPNADRIKLLKSIDYIQQLHQPFHRHILSEKILQRMALESGLKILKTYYRSYFDTLFPFINQRFVTEIIQKREHFVDGFDDDPLKLSEILKSPKLCFYALFGYFFSRKPEITLIFSKLGTQ